MVFASGQKLFKPENILEQTRVNFFYRENMTSFLNYTTTTLRALFAWHGSINSIEFSHWSSEWVWVYWCFTSHATIFQLYIWRHRCAGGLNKLYLRSGSQRHGHFVGFFNRPVQVTTWGQPFYTVFLRNRPIKSPFTTRWGYEGPILILIPRSPHGGIGKVSRNNAWIWSLYLFRFKSYSKC